MEWDFVVSADSGRSDPLAIRVIEKPILLLVPRSSYPALRQIEMTAKFRSLASGSPVFHCLAVREGAKRCNGKVKGAALLKIRLY